MKQDKVLVPREVLAGTEIPGDNNNKEEEEEDKEDFLSAHLSHKVGA